MSFLPFAAIRIISTHSLTRRLTVTPVRRSIVAEISTHSLTRRLTFRENAVRQAVEHFNSQPHKEADSRSTNAPDAG